MVGVKRQELDGDQGAAETAEGRPAQPYFGAVAVFGLVLLLAAALLHFAVAPRTSPGFSYLAVIVALWALGTLIAAGLRE